MKAVVENLSGLSRKIKVTVPPDQINDEINKRIMELAKKVNIKGFRTGKKVPDKVIKMQCKVVKMQYGDSVRQEVIQDMVWQSLQEAFEDQKIYPAGTPRIERIDMKEGESLEYEASFDVRPDVELSNIGEISVEKPQAEVKDENVQNVIEQLRKQNAKLNEVDRNAQEGDVIIIDFEGFIEDMPFAGGSAKNFKLELGSQRMIPGFEEPLMGTKAGDEVEVNVTFPEDYHAEDLAGKLATFKVKVQQVMESELPELDDNFAKDLGVSDGTVSGLFEEVRQNLERELNRRIHERIKNQIINQLVDKHEIEVPQSLVDDEINRMQEHMQKQLSQQSGQKNIPKLPREQFEVQARRNVALGLLLSQWIKDQDIKVDSSKVRERIEEIASGYHQPRDIIDWYYNNKDIMAEIEGAVLEEQAIDALLEHVKVTEKVFTYDDIMNPSVQRGEE